MVFKQQRAVGVVLAFLAGLVTSIFISTFIKGKLGEDSSLVGKGRSTLYLEEVVSNDTMTIPSVVSPSQNTDSLTLLILVFSRPEARSTRQAVRSTWAVDVEASDDVTYFFVINVLQLSNQLASSLEEESETHRDMMFLNEKPTLMPNSRALLAALQSVNKSFGFKFLLKCNDTSYIVVPKILQQLEEMPRKELVWGFFAGNEAVMREGIHAERDWNLCIKYLPYPQGGGYILSHDIVSMLVAMGPDLNHLDNEDIAVGVWLAPFNIQRRHDVKFNTGIESRGCNNVYLVTHGMTATGMEEMHKSLKTNGVLCTSEYQARLSYMYDWSAAMPDCCTRKKGIP